MTLPPLTTVLAMYAVATGLLWILTRIFRPKDREISVLRCFGVAFVLTFLGNASERFLTPLIGDWILLLFVVLHIVIVMGLLSLSLWRSIWVALIYCTGVLTFAYFFLPETVQ